MRLKSELLATALGITLLAAPALAQMSPAPMTTPMTPAPQGSAERAMPHHGHHHGMRTERRAERRAMREENRQDAAGLVEEASEALRRGRTAQATDLLEQSETRLLTRSIPADRAGQPMRSPALDSLASARSAIQNRDRAGAQREMEQALAILRRDGGMSGADASGTMPMGGSGMGQGMTGQGMGMPGRTMQDGGRAGSSMSRADGIIRVQSGGQDMRTRRDGDPATSHGTVNRGSGGVGAAPQPGTTPTPQVTGSGRSSSGGAVTTGTPSSGNASGATTPPTGNQSGGTGGQPAR
jgi:hypothetical protein